MQILPNCHFCSKVKLWSIHTKQIALVTRSPSFAMAWLAPNVVLLEFLLIFYERNIMSTNARNKHRFDVCWESNNFLIPYNHTDNRAKFCVYDFFFRWPKIPYANFWLVCFSTTNSHAPQQMHTIRSLLYAHKHRPASLCQRLRFVCDSIEIERPKATDTNSVCIRIYSSDWNSCFTQVQF